MLSNRRTLAENYDLISWIMRIFLGGALNIVFLNAMAAFIEAHVTYNPTGPNGPTYNLLGLLSSTALTQFTVLLVLTFISPIAISLSLTKREPNLKIVPPFYVVLIGIAWILISWILPFEGIRFFFILMFGFIFFFAGFVEDKVVTSILGVTTEREYIYFEHLEVFGEIEDVKARLTVPEIRDQLLLSHRIDGDAAKGYLLRTKRGYIFINKIALTKNKQDPEQVTDLKIVYYERARYNLRASPAFIQEAHARSQYLKFVLTSEPMIGFRMVTEFTNTVKDSLIDSVIDEMYGYYVKSKRFSTGDKIKVTALAGVFVMTVVLFIIDQPFFGGLSAVLDALFALSELPDILRRQT